MLYENWSQVPNTWGAWPAKYFKPEELASKGDGSLLLDIEFLTALDRLRSAYGSPLTVNSAYRDPRHNALCGGSPLSRHKAGDAVDISIVGEDKELIRRLANTHGGWNGQGLYRSFIHLDRRGYPARWGTW
jgi:uncharacterized protein YcbK (DUF882 family)